MASEQILPGADALLTVVTRGEHVESWHRGVLVVVRGNEILFAAGDPQTPVHCRSATKPMQALPLVELGGADRLALTAPELAVLCASHHGSAAHVRTVTALLARGGFTEADLQCGAHAPRDRTEREALQRRGEPPRRIHNNCSGKHAGFLHLAALCGDDPRRHLAPDSRAQQLVRDTLADLAELRAAQIDTTIDGCGAPTFRLPLVGLATAFRRFANPSGLAPVRAAACRRLLDAIAEAPFHLQGEGGLCTMLVESARGRVLPKNGAEGVFAIGLPGQDLGIAIKVADGNERGYTALVPELLRWLGLWPEIPRELQPFHRAPVHNTQGRQVGELRPVLEWPA